MAVTPEIHLYEYPLSEVPVPLAQPMTQLSVVPEVTRAVSSVAQAISHYYKPPTRWIEPLLLATNSNMLEGFKSTWNKERKCYDMLPATVVGENVDLGAVAALIHAWARVWRDDVRDNYLEALPHAENLLRLVTDLWGENKLLEAQTCLLSDIILDETGSLNSAAYTLVPAVLLRQLHGRKTPVAGGKSIVWELAVGREESFAISELLPAANQALFAYKLEADLQTLAGPDGEVPVVQLRLKQQRYPDGPVMYLPKNKPSILLGTERGLWCKVSRSDYEYVRREVEVGATALPEWDALPELEKLKANPERYLKRARFIHLSGMQHEQSGKSAPHQLQVGMTFEERQDVLDPVVQSLELDVNTEVEADVPLADLLATLGRKGRARSIWAWDRVKRSKSADLREILHKRILNATDGKGLEIVVVTRRSHQKFVRELLPTALEDVFGGEIAEITDEPVQILPRITCRVVQFTAEEAALLETLDKNDISEEGKDGKRRMEFWRPAYKQRYHELLTLLRIKLPVGDGPVRFAFIDKPVPPPGNIAKWEDVKGIARAAFAELNYLSQFVNPYYPKKDGTEGVHRDVSHRIRQGLLDGLRQLGVVLGEPADLYELMGLPPVDVISVVLVRTDSWDIRYPVFSRLSADGKVALRFPRLNGELTEWAPSYEAIPALVRLVWSTIDSLKMPGAYRKNSPLVISSGRIIDYIRESLEITRPTVLVVPAAKLGNKYVWKQLRNTDLGQQRHKLVLGANLSVERDHPSWQNLLGIVRYRGPAREVPEYFPVSDRIGTSRDYRAAQGWFTESEQFVRYLGVGTIQSTQTNREKIHHDAHSLRDSKRVRPTTGTEVEVGASRRYPHARLIEFVPFFVSSALGEDGAVALCRLAQLTRMMGWHTTTLSLPWPAHVASTAMKDALDAIAAYDDIS